MDCFNGFSSYHHALNGTPCAADATAMPHADTAAGPARRFFSLSEAGRIFGKSARTMRSWADGGQLRTVSIGRVRYVTEAEIARLANGGEG